MNCYCLAIFCGIAVVVVDLVIVYVQGFKIYSKIYLCSSIAAAIE